MESWQDGVPDSASLRELMAVLLVSGSILKHQEDTFAAELHRLKQQPLFSLVDFENLMDSIRSTVAEVSSEPRLSRVCGSTIT